MLILHTLLYIFLKVLKGEFVYQSRTSFVDDHFLYSHDLNVWFRLILYGEISCQRLNGLQTAEQNVIGPTPDNYMQVEPAEQVPLPIHNPP